LSKFKATPGRAVTLALPEPNLAVVPEPFGPPGLSVAQFSAVLLAYWKQVTVITLLVAFLGALAVKFLPKTYTATATLIVNSDLKDPLAGRDFPAEMINNYVTTQTELMTSPIVLQPVISKLGLMTDRNFTGGASGSEEAVRETVLKNLAASMAVERGIGGQLLYISASSKSAAKASEIANTVADVYIDQDRHRLNDPAGERAQRYTEELAELREKATVAQNKVTAFRKEHGIGESPAIEIQELESLHQHLIDAQSQRRALEAKLTGQPTADEVLGSAALDAQLAQLAQLSATYGPQHPKVREINAQIAVTRQSLANGNHALTVSTETDLARAKELERKYLQAVADQQVKVTKLKQAQDEGSKLVLELDSANAVYKQALDGFDQVMFQAVASHTNVSIVSRAVPPLRASKPNKMKLLLVVLVAAVGIGVGAPLGYGIFVARRLRCRDDMERDFGISVLAKLEAVPSLAGAV
jgi:succinoglycan biosynthesis transport protein ExoP